MLLSFPDEPPIRSYLHHAYTTGILSAQSRFDCVLGDYLNFELRRGDAYSGEETFLDFTPYVDLATLAQKTRISVRDESAAFVLSLSEASLSEHLVRTLNDDAYLLVYLDEYYAPWAASFSRAHRTSQHLLLGFDRGKFKGVNYRADSSFGGCDISSEYLWKAMSSQARSDAPLQNEKLLRALRFESPSETKTEKIHHLAALESFWESRPTPGQDRQPGYLYGADCYDAIVDEMDRVISANGRLDLRRTRLLCERASIVGRLLKDDSSPAIGRSEWDRECLRIVALFQSAHLAAYQYSLKQKGESSPLPSRVGDLISQAAEAERGLFSQIREHDIS